MQKKTVAIIGLGLMGGSLAMALKRKSKFFRVFAISRDSNKIRQAIRNRVIDQGSIHLKDIPQNTDLVVIATPVPQIVSIALALDKIFEKPVLMTDVGSTKVQIVDKLKKVKFVGSHPMAGDHNTGLEAARPDLYDKALVFVTRDHASSPDVKKIELFWKKVGANRLITLAARDHDRIVGEISHLPHLAATALTLCASPSHMLLSGPGFKDSTRIAQGDPDLWLGIISTNKNLPVQLEQFEHQIRKIKSFVKNKQWPSLRVLLSQASQRRRNM
ncbi:MAG: prephenate dehydrogenase/arogenate dehydrogenase family protein [Candidatus Omnitrophica bacterium]|nr:prephenate dehydrogenase/arogenate dehydrogenase family protein [Candidatus Omnitrophota bacterium]